MEIMQHCLALQAQNVTLQVYGTQKASKIVLWVAVGVACFFGVIALMLLTAPLWDKRRSESDPEAGSDENGQHEPLMGSQPPNNAVTHEQQ